MQQRLCVLRGRGVDVLVIGADFFVSFICLSISLWGARKTVDGSGSVL